MLVSGPPPPVAAGGFSLLPSVVFAVTNVNCSFAKVGLFLSRELKSVFPDQMKRFLPDWVSVQGEILIKPWQGCFCGLPSLPLRTDEKELIYLIFLGLLQTLHLMPLSQDCSRLPG